MKLGLFNLMTQRDASTTPRQIVEDTIALYQRDGKPLPPPTSGRDFANRMQSVA